MNRGGFSGGFLASILPIRVRHGLLSLSAPNSRAGQTAVTNGPASGCFQLVPKLEGDPPRDHPRFQGLLERYAEDVER